MDIGSKFIHFAGIGSAMSFINNGNGNVPKSYVDWAKSRYAIYMKVFYNQEIDIPYDDEYYKKIKNFLKF